jgi:ABC-2 type transport system permease protein
MLKIIQAVVRKDLRQYFMDKKAVLISLLVPLGIAFFMATIFGSQSDPNKPVTKIEVLVASESAVELKKVLTALQRAKDVSIIPTTPEEAREKVKAGKVPLAVIIPDGFMDQTMLAFGEKGAKKPEMELLADPSRKIEAAMAQGQISGGIMNAIVSGKYGSQFSTQDEETVPYETKTTDLGPEKAKKAEESRVATVAHIFCGMAIQGILFGAIEAAMQLMRDRQKGLLRRLTAAPLSPKWFLLGRIFSSAIKAFFVLTIVLCIGMLLFRFRVTGSPVGLLAILAASSLMSASFGLFVSALGKTEAQSRGLATLAVLIMSMVGGAWFPSFMFPGWVQNVSKLIPVRWAVDGLDAMIWRGQSVVAVFPFVGVTLAFASVFALIGLWRFSWDAETA